MHQLPTDVWQEEERLGKLAMEFRGANRDDERASIAAQYAATVDRLIKSGAWQEIQTFEDQLPNAWMPDASPSVS